MLVNFVNRLMFTFDNVKPQKLNAILAISFLPVGSLFCCFPFLHVFPSQSHFNSLTKQKGIQVAGTGKQSVYFTCPFCVRFTDLTSPKMDGTVEFPHMMKSNT